MIDEVFDEEDDGESNDGLNSSFLLFTNLSQLKSAIIGIIKRKFYSRGEGMFKNY